MLHLRKSKPSKMKDTQNQVSLQREELSTSGRQNDTVGRTRKCNWGGIGRTGAVLGRPKTTPLILRVRPISNRETDEDSKFKLDWTGMSTGHDANKHRIDLTIKS